MRFMEALETKKPMRRSAWKIYDTDEFHYIVFNIEYYGFNWANKDGTDSYNTFGYLADEDLTADDWVIQE